MIVYLGVIFLFSSNVRAVEDSTNHGMMKDKSGADEKFSLWPSVHNGVTMMSLRKRDVMSSKAGVQGHNEGGDPSLSKQVVDLPTHVADAENVGNKTQLMGKEAEFPLGNATSLPRVPPTVAILTNTTTNSSVTIATSPGTLDINNPGVVKRGLIVFSGFALLAVAYLIFYRAKTKKDAGNQSNNDGNQFKYGVLESDDMKDNLELSRMPLTMESDDEEDEDLEIFDLEQRKKSMSYVTLETKDQDVVFNTSHRENQEESTNILLDIDENDTDQLINWSSQGNKSIL